VYIGFENQKIKLQAHEREIADVSGAGDTVVSVAALCTALQLEPRVIGLLVEPGRRIGVPACGRSAIDKDEFIKEASKDFSA